MRSRQNSLESIEPLFNTDSNPCLILRSVASGLRPGKVLLAEHYRSDARIIGFSTGILPESTQNKDRSHPQGTAQIFPERLRGVVWVHVAGRTERPETGSAYNPQEVAAIQQYHSQAD